MGESEIKVGDTVHVKAKSATACDNMDGIVISILDEKATISFNYGGVVDGFPLHTLQKI